MFRFAKKNIRAFKFLGFKIEISFAIKVTNFLDVTVNLPDNTYKPFLMTNQYPSYIDVNSNQPSFIIKQVLKAANARICRLSSNKNIFHERSKMHIETHKRSGFKEEFIHQETKIDQKQLIYIGFSF